MRALRGSLADLRHHFVRYLAILAAIGLSVGFAVATQILVPTAMSGVASKMIPYTADAIASADFTTHRGNDDSRVASEQDVATLRQAVEGKAGFESYAVKGYSTQMQAVGDTKFLRLQTVPDKETFRWFRLVEGQLPTAANDVVLPAELTTPMGLRVGDKVTLQDAPGGRTMNLVGLSDQTSSFSSPALVSEAALDPRSHVGVTLLVNGPGSPQETVDAVRASVAPDVGRWLRTPGETRAEILKSMTRGQDTGKLMALAFGAIAMLVCVIIVATTFSILMTGRRRQIGLLRAVGAYQSQVAWRYALEALVVGLLGSVLGLGIGVGAAAAIAAIADWLGGGLVIPWPTVLVLCGAGTIIVLLASLGPIRKSMRTSPLEALRPVAPADDARRSSRVRAIVCAALIAVGVGILVVATRMPGNSETVLNVLLLAVTGAILVTIGVLTSASLYVPWLVRLLGKAFSPLGATSRLATQNAVRNPKRAGATATALMLAVGLITTLIVAVGTAKASTEAHLNATRPIDLIVESPKGTYPGGLDQVKGLQANSPLLGTRGTLKITGEGFEQYIGYAPRLGDVVRRPTAQPADDEILLSQFSKPKDPPATVTVTVGGKSVELKPIWVPFGAALVSEKTLSTLTSERTAYATWYRVQDDASIGQVVTDVRALTTPAELQLSGTATERLSLLERFNDFLLVMLALLGISAVIALMGVGNTLGLSVLERTRESAILRAVGLQSLGLRLMLFLEAVLLTLAGVGVAIVAGIAFGWVGSRIMVSMMGWPTVWNIPWWQIAGVIAIAMASGMVASILPGHRAAKAAPVEALADEG